MANPVLYSNRYSAQVIRNCPSITQERFMEGFDHTSSLVNVLIGVANEVARLAISDGIDAIRQAGLYRQKTKQLCNMTVRYQEEYEAAHNSNFGDRLIMWLDYLNSTEEEYRRYIFLVYNAVKMILGKHHQQNADMKARLECALICAQLAVGKFDELMSAMKKKFGVDYTPIFIRGRYTKPLYTWNQLCSLYVKTDDPDDFIDLNQDANLCAAVDLLARKLSDEDTLNRVGKHALDLNPEMAHKYAGSDDSEIKGNGK